VADNENALKRVVTFRRNAVKTIQTDNAPAAIGPYSQGIVAGMLLYTAGQVGFDPATGEFVEGGIEAQTERVLENLSAILTAAGTDLAHVVKTTVFLTTMDDFAAMNGVYTRWLGATLPARSTVAVSGLPRGALVEIEAVALLPDAAEIKARKKAEKKGLKQANKLARKAEKKRRKAEKSAETPASPEA
jgi:2-iminobutanoate/2-iminopropanoate deaminase